MIVVTRVILRVLSKAKRNLTLLVMLSDLPVPFLNGILMRNEAAVPVRMTAPTLV